MPEYYCYNHDNPGLYSLKIENVGTKIKLCFTDNPDGGSLLTKEEVERFCSVILHYIQTGSAGSVGTYLEFRKERNYVGIRARENNTCGLQINTGSMSMTNDSVHRMAFLLKHLTDNIEVIQ
jgi:hypothetical protein